MAEQMSARTIVLLASGIRTSSSQGSEITVPPGFQDVRLVLSVTAASGTTPTLNVFLQDGIIFAAAADIAQARTTGTKTWNDFAAFAQVVAAAVRHIGITPGGNFEAAAQNAALTAATIRSGPLGQRWRVKWAVGGTSPSFTFSVFAEFRT